MKGTIRAARIGQGMALPDALANGETVEAVSAGFAGYRESWLENGSGVGHGRGTDPAYGNKSDVARAIGAKAKGSGRKRIFKQTPFKSEAGPVKI
jgi:hypothetical protein